MALVVLVSAIAATLVWYGLGRPVSVTTARVEKGPAVELVYATGFVEAEHPVSVSSRLTAPIIEVLVDEGQRVARGQPLVHLDAAEQRALLAQAQAEATSKSLAERRIVALFAKGWVTKAARDEAVAAGKGARAALAAVGARLDQSTVRAGIAGVVLKRDVEPGDLATPGMELFQLGDPARARVTATVDERDIGRVRPGQRALLSSDALPDRVIEGHVADITPGGDPSQRAFRVRIAFDRPTDLPFGLTLEVNIVTQERSAALLVPAAAVDKGVVWLVRDGRAERREVQLGISGDEKIEIRAGVAAGDQVVVAPPADLAEGDRVAAK